MGNELIKTDKYADLCLILNKWAEEKSNGRIKDFGEKIEILDVEDGGVIKSDYQTRYVRREFEENRVMSFDGEDIPESVSSPLGLWEYNTEGNNQNGTDDKIITKTEYEEEFKQLQKKIEQAEKNNDVIKLYELNSDIEKYNTYETFLESKFEENRACYPLKETFKLSTCPRCAGSGKVPCTRCDGSGKILEYGKRVYCPTCEGAKNVICHICHGKKKVVKHTALYEYFTYENETKFIKSDNLPEIFSKGVESLDGYEADSNEGIIINQSNADAIFEHFAEIQRNLSADEAKTYKIFEEELKSFMTSKSNNLDFNIRINQFIIKNFSLYFKIVKYVFNQKEYSVLIYGKDNKVYTPEDMYPEEIKKIESEINKKKKDKISKTLENLNASKKSRLLTLLLCVLLGFLGMHRIYVGRKSSGSFLGICIIFSFLLYDEYELSIFLAVMAFLMLVIVIDFILILMGKFKDKEKKYVKKWI